MNIFPKILNSASLLLGGLILLYGSQSVFFTLGNKGRYAALAAGFACVMWATYRRASVSGIVKQAPCIIVSGLYFGCLMVLSLMQGHNIFYAQKLVFIGVCFALFIAGYVLAKTPTRDGQWTDSIVMMGGSAFLILILYRFLSYVKMISFAGTERSFDVSELNPVGAAYTNMVLVLVFLYMAISVKRIWTKPLYAIVAGIAALVVITTGSRGAPLWGIIASLSILSIMVANGVVKVNVKTIVTILAFAAFGIPVAMYLFQTNYALSEKLSLLMHRFDELFYMAKGGADEASTSARLYFWQYYLSNFETWILAGERGYSSYPHNQWLEIMVRFGLLGIPLWFFSMFVLAKSLFKAFSRKYALSIEWYLVMLVFLFSYLQSMSSLSLEVNRTLWLGFGYLFGYQYQLKSMMGSSVMRR